MTLERLLDNAPLHCVNVYVEDGLATIVTIVPDGTYNVWDEPPATVPEVDPNEKETEPPTATSEEGWTVCASDGFYIAVRAEFGSSRT